MKKKILKTLLITVMATLLMGCNKEVNENVDKKSNDKPAIKGEFIDIDILDTGIDFSEDKVSENTADEEVKFSQMYTIDDIGLKYDGTEYIIPSSFSSISDMYNEYQKEILVFELSTINNTILHYTNCVDTEDSEDILTKKAMVNLVKEHPEIDIKALSNFLLLDVKEARKANEDLDTWEEGKQYPATKIDFYSSIDGSKIDFEKDKEKIVKTIELLVDLNDNFESKYTDLPYNEDLNSIELGYTDTVSGMKEEDFNRLNDLGYHVLCSVYGIGTVESSVNEDGSISVSAGTDEIEEYYIFMKGDILGEYELYKMKKVFDPITGTEHLEIGE